MGENKSGSGLPFNLTTMLALLTFVGGLWVVSKNPSSGRPNSTAEIPYQSLGDQAVQARLWEDPFGAKAQATNMDAVNLLRAQIAARSGGGRPILLPVMIHGGPYSEDRESRIRSRYAIISALGESGYVPEDENHVGLLDVAWPVTAEISDWLKNSSGALRLSFNTNKPPNVPGCSDHLPIGFEWYRSRVFNQSNNPPAEQRVLVLWLNEDQFEDYPHARLALLLNELANSNRCLCGCQPNNSITNLFTSVNLIGPRSSTVLRALLPPFGKSSFDTNSFSLAQQASIANVLHMVDVFCPTPSAMDAVLVTNCANAPPRQPVARILTNFWFNSFHNFCATDAQLAWEAFAELKLRQIDLNKKAKNLVLISEWDTFYGRSLKLTYAAELAKFQGVVSNELDFVTNYLAGAAVWPTNLHCFAYLRGLDGQTTKPKPDTQTGAGRRDTPSLESLVAGDPNESKAEGEAQFDYMNRLCDRLKALERDWESKGLGRVDAVGICGSDTYDTLVILQVLRRNFPNTVFFTTDLDARFSHPKEQEWARNLIVLSSYGLQLEEKLQGGVAPFRESGQTAQFAATLAALGDSRLRNLGSIPPRRFEIGNGRAFDLSVTNDGFLQPMPPAGRLMSLRQIPSRIALAVVFVSGGLLAFFSWRRVQRLTRDATEYENACLWFRKEDIGGRQGVIRILRQLEHFTYETFDPVASWLWNSLIDTVPGLVRKTGEISSVEAQAFLDFLNKRVLQSGAPLDHVSKSKLITEETRNAFRQLHLENQSQGAFLEKNSVRQMRLHRRLLDEFFYAILKPETSSLPAAELAAMDELADATKSARLSGEMDYRLRFYQRWATWIGFPVLLVIIFLFIRAAFIDSKPCSSGEPFYFFAGISVWPTECLRLIAFVLAVLFVVKTHISLRAGVLQLSRDYRLPLTMKKCRQFKWRLPSTPAPLAAVDAAMIWEHYQQLGQFRHRITRILPMFVSYFAFCVGITILIGDSPYSPVRGNVSSWWNCILLFAAVLTFLFLAFWIIDAACLCRWLVERFSESPTHYPKSCLRYFARLRGLERKGDSLAEQQKRLEENESILAEWIDLQLIAELTARVGRLVYLPFIIFFILIISRNNIFDRWPWPPCLVIIFGLNLCLCVASMIILRNSALKAREAGLAALRARVEEAEQDANPDEKASRASVARNLLNELQSLDKGAFAPLWENPLLGAILIPSGGSVLIELMTYLFR